MNSHTKAWSEVTEGDRVRFVQPSRILVGEVVRVKGRSLKVRWDGQSHDTVVPDAREYWANGKDPLRHAIQGMYLELASPALETEPLVPRNLTPTTSTPASPSASSASRRSGMGASKAAAHFGVAAKDLRRWLRSGKVRGRQNSAGKWLVDPQSLGQYLAERR